MHKIFFPFFFFFYGCGDKNKAPVSAPLSIPRLFIFLLLGKKEKKKGEKGEKEEEINKMPTRFVPASNLWR